jgi:hypothetical protein
MRIKALDDSGRSYFLWKLLSSSIRPLADLARRHGANPLASSSKNGQTGISVKGTLTRDF